MIDSVVKPDQCFRTIDRGSCCNSQGYKSALRDLKDSSQEESRINVVNRVQIIRTQTNSCWSPEYLKEESSYRVGLFELYPFSMGIQPAIWSYRAHCKLKIVW